MLKIRLARRGKKRQPFYRIVVAEASSKRDGRYVEQIGHYNPMVDPIEYKLKEDRALHWLSVGAQPTEAAERLLKKQGTYERLARLHAGEELGALAAEFNGETWPPVETTEESATETAPVVEETPVAIEEKEVVAEVIETTEDAPSTEGNSVAVKPDDLTRIDGIGPKIAATLQDAGIVSFLDLAGKTPDELKTIVRAAGISAVADTWPTQSTLAAAGDWDELDTLQGKLDGGRAA